QSRGNMKLVVLASLVGLSLGAPSSGILASLKLRNAGLYQGDIKGIAGVKPGEEHMGRAAINDDAYLWTNGVVPYQIMDPSTQSMIRGAMDEIEAKTCVRFVPHSNENDYIYITSSSSGCWSYVGSYGGAQEVSLDRNGCLYHGTAIHELMHAIGFYHEHCRNDRDSYVYIHYENVQAGYAYAFDKDTNWRYVGEGYNYNSIMHYGAYSFSVDPWQTKTIDVLMDGYTISDPWEKSEMAQSDANQINNLYAGQCGLREK
ncbi:unnamed protein product, partial [Meganyctiphanes norvegica]